MQAATRLILGGKERAAASPNERLSILSILLLVVLIFVELASRGIHDRRQSTLDIEHGVEDALLIRRVDDVQQILFAGNSLVYDDISQAEIQRSLGPDSLVHTAGVPGSTYHDWQYGVVSLMGRGSQPDVIVFGISPSQMVRPAAVTQLPVSLLWRTRDLMNYVRAERPTLTASSELLLEHYSSFFYMRDTIRIFIRKRIPGYVAMVEGWNRHAAVAPREDESRDKENFEDRLSRLQIACGPHARLVLLIAPTRQDIDEALEPSLRSAARKLLIPVIEPVGEKEWPITRFRDGYHMNSSGAQEFSKLVARDLLPIVRNDGARR